MRADGAGHQDHTDDLFGGSASYCISLLDSFAQGARATSYRITPVSEYEVIKVIAQSNEIYWREILYRAHFAASTALLRLREWLHGTLRSHSDRNVLMLAAGLRGLLEAVADTWEGIADVAPTLADTHTVVRDALACKLGDRMYLLPELENDLIHFAYAHKKHEGEYSPRLHDAKSARECISVLAESVPDVTAAYATLCEYSHPASPTVFRFATAGPDPNMLTFDPRAGAQQLRQLQELARRIGPTVLAVGIAPCVVTLKTLNAFELEAVKTPWAERIALSFSGVWRSIDEKLRGAGSPRIASAEEEASIMGRLFSYYEPLRKKQKK